jgi:TetR/AcrR family transcriptional regulator
MVTSAESRPRIRAPQRRAEQTRASVLGAAIELFSSLGFEGVSLRTLEAHAGVQRGAVAYHFGTKDALWRAAVDRVFERFAAHFAPLESTLRDLPRDARVRAAIAAFVRFSAEMPELSRMMVQEGKQASWRLAYLVDRYIRPQLDWLRGVAGFPLDAHTFYAAVGAASVVFDVEHECRRLFGVDPTSDAFIREHAARVADLVLAAARRET